MTWASDVFDGDVDELSVAATNVFHALAVPAYVYAMQCQHVSMVPTSKLGFLRMERIKRQSSKVSSVDGYRVLIDYWDGYDHVFYTIG